MSAVRRGGSYRRVARRFGVSVRTVQVWVARAAGQRMDRVEWGSRRPGRPVPVNRTAPRIETRVLAVRRELRTVDVLGEYGAVAIHEALRTKGVHPLPSVRTVGRILVRGGAIDARQRVRRPAPPPGWHLPAVAQRTLELEQFDVIEDLKLAEGPLIDVFTGVAVHSGWPQARPLLAASTTRILACLRAHWRRAGLPGYAQFDNDTRFQGAHQHPDVFGRVSRFCLHVGVTPVFVPPRELGLQNAIEHFNGLFQAKVWRRFRFPSLATLVAHTARYVAARCHRLAARASAAPARRPWGATSPFRPERLPLGRVIYIRRTDAHGRIHLLGHTWPVATHWCHRLVRAELDLATEQLACFALRRSAPDDQPLLRQIRYHYPRADLAR